MHFFIPGANDRRHAMSVYANIRGHVEQQYGKLKTTLIYRVGFPYGETRYTLAVGDSLHLKEGHPIMAIFEGREYYICTGVSCEVDPEPLVIGCAGDIRVELFEEVSYRMSSPGTADAPRSNSARDYDPRDYNPMEEKAIAQLAYELWEQRGRPLGSSEQDWDRAVRAIRRARQLA